MIDGGRPVGLIETIYADGGETALLYRHLARLEASASALGYPFEFYKTLSRIVKALDAHSGSGVEVRLRLVLWPDGTLDHSIRPYSHKPLQTASVYPEAIMEAGTWRCAHKTTARAHYDRTLAWAHDHGIDEPILLNPRGEVMEGARTNVFIREGSRLVTPPLSSGGLDGVMRREMLRLGADERRLTPRDLTEADEVLLVNALRGAMSVELREVA